MTNWKINPSAATRHEVKELLNSKYGKSKFEMNLRSVCLDDFKKVLVAFSSHLNKTCLVGANNFSEVSYFPKFDALVGVDLAYTALSKPKLQLKNIVPVIGDAEELPFPNNAFDEYISLRTLFSSHTDLIKSLKEAERVTKNNGKILISVSNGYLVNKTIIKGMFDYKKGTYDIKKPYLLISKASKYFETKGYKVVQKEIESEIFILVKKK